MYKYAWEKHNLNVLDSIFTLDIVYQEKPENILNGLEEVKNYWLENSIKQKDVLFNVKEYAIIGDEMMIDWSASFYHLIKRKNVNLKGIMCWTLVNGKINTLKESFITS